MIQKKKETMGDRKRDNEEKEKTMGDIGETEKRDNGETMETMETMGDTMGDNGRQWGQ
jgi:hypothetical protein